jgi:hypothetical protein
MLELKLITGIIKKMKFSLFFSILIIYINSSLLKTNNQLNNEIQGNDMLAKNKLPINFNKNLKIVENYFLGKYDHFDNFLKTRKINSEKSNFKIEKPFYKINSIYTNITLNTKTNTSISQINEQITYELSGGTFTSIVRKISLSGSSFFAFKVSSNSEEIKIKGVKVINNCFEEKQSKINHETSNEKIQDHSISDYICVISIMEEINTKDSKKYIQLNYDYFANNLLWREMKNNSFFWYYDNSNREEIIESINFNLIFKNFQLKKDLLDLKVDLLKNNSWSNIKNNTDNDILLSKLPDNTTNLRLEIKKIDTNSVIKIALKLPYFHKNAKILVS